MTIEQIKEGIRIAESIGDTDTAEQLKKQLNNMVING